MSKSDETLGPKSSLEHNLDGRGIKFDTGKLKWHLLPMKYLRGVVEVLMFGAKKYDEHNWRKGMPYSQPYNALQRHLDAFMEGVDKDDETGLHHLDHAMCCLMFLRANTMDFPELDDRFKPPQKEKLTFKDGIFKFDSHSKGVM